VRTPGSSSQFAAATPIHAHEVQCGASDVAFASGVVVPASLVLVLTPQTVAEWSMLPLAFVPLPWSARFCSSVDGSLAAASSRTGRSQRRTAALWCCAAGANGSGSDKNNLRL